MNEITPSVFYAGVLNPSMRVFDVVMHTEYGTSYNSYLVKGSEKTALIEGSHRDFLEYFTHNINDAAGKTLGKDLTIDYLVINHTEPDHSGCLEEFLTLYPGITVIASPAAAVYLKNITNLPNLSVQVVKDGDSVSLGDKTLEFINAPFLHWPDSMFTWCPEEKVLFSCDFLGAHFCEPQIFDYKILYKQEYWDALKYYFDVIFTPFSPYVLAGLDKIKELDIEYLCGSHGPVLTKGHALERAIALYCTWATPIPHTNKRIPIFYTTAYGSTERLAKAIAEGIAQVLPTAEVELYNIIERNMEELHKILNDSDALLLGTLTINRDSVPPMWNLLAGIDAINFRGRPVALFGSFGWSGEAFANTSARLEGVRAKVFEEPYKINFVPNVEELEQAKEFGKRFAQSLA